MTAPTSAGLSPLAAYVAYRTLLHGRDQEAIAAELALAMYPLWAIQKFTDLDRSTPLWLSAALPTVKTAYLQSQRVAAVYANDVRNASLPLEDPLPMVVPDVELPSHVPAVRFDKSLIPSVSLDPEQPVIHFDEFPVEDVATSLTIQGNYEIKAAMPAPEDEAMYNGLKDSSGAATRQAMNGGRNVTNNLVAFDRRIIGYARYTDSNPCYFCALLAARGAMYSKSSNRGGRRKSDGSLTKGDKDFTPNPNGAKDLPDGFIPAKVHDHCKCTLRPVYAKSQDMDADAKFYKQQWEDLNEKYYGLSNSDLIGKWREEYVPYHRPALSISDVRDELQERASALSDAGHAPFSPQVQWANQQLAQLAA
jgi:hypothetical protein